MFGSLTPLILSISSLKSGTTIVLHQASKHAAYSPSLSVLLCESIKVVASSMLLTRALYIKRKALDVTSQGVVTNADGYARLQAEEFEVQEDENDVNKEGGHVSPSLLESGQESGSRMPSTLLQHILSQVFQLQGLRLIVPALIYVVQNNLYLYAASELDPAFFQALWQMRILMSATLSWAVLKKRIMPMQWLCILGIFVGVMLVKSATTTSRAVATGVSAKTLTASIALCAAAMLSSTAGVILEFIFRDRSVNLWASNVQLSCFSILPAAAIVFVRDRSHLAPVLQDLQTSPWPMGVVLCQSFNGMMIAMLLKKAGVIINDFTSAASIVLTFMLNEMLFPASSKIDSALDIVLVVLGSSVILGCSIVYNRSSPKEETTEVVDASAEQDVSEVNVEETSFEDLNLELDDISRESDLLPSSSLSSPAVSSVATPSPASPMAHYFNLNASDVHSDTKVSEHEQVTLIEMHDLPPLKH